MEGNETALGRTEGCEARLLPYHLDAACAFRVDACMYSLSREKTSHWEDVMSIYCSFFLDILLYSMSMVTARTCSCGC